MKTFFANNIVGVFVYHHPADYANKASPDILI